MANCRKIRRKLSCYLDKELTETEEILVNRHLIECSECREELNLLLKVSKVLKADEETESFPGFEARFWMRVVENENRRVSWLNPLSLLPQTAVIILIGVFLGVGAGQILSMSLAKREFMVSLDLARFSNFQPDSISRAYQRIGDRPGG